jgi:deoxyadenosine/deoxycytidine kinase
MYTLNYKSEDKCLCVEPSNSHYRVVGATVKGQSVPQHTLNNLIFQATEETSSPIKKRSSSPDLQPPPPTFPSSPTSICSLNDDSFTPQSIFSAAVIAKLRDLVFSLPSTLNIPTVPVVQEHTPILISIEGNIGAGKSTLLNNLRLSHPEWTFIEEPVDFWATLKNSKGQSLFELYYHDQERWSYTFQNCAVLSRYQYIEETIAKQKAVSSGRQVYITERCLDTDHKVFAQMLHDDDKMDSLEYSLYERWIEQLKRTSTPLSGIIYIDTPAEVCADRIRGRNRDGEEGIPLQYLHELQKYQSSWIDSTHESQDPTPIVRTCCMEEVEAFVINLLLVSAAAAGEI